MLNDVIVFVESAKRVYCSLNHNTLRHTLSLAGERDVGCKALRRYVTLRHSHACQNNMSNVHALATNIRHILNYITVNIKQHKLLSQS